MDLIRFAHRIRHVELALGMRLPSLRTPGLHRADDCINKILHVTKSMGSIKAQLHAIDTLIVHLNVDATDINDSVAKDGSWWSLRTGIREPFVLLRTEGQEKPFRAWVIALLEAANSHEVGKKRIFKLLVERNQDGYTKRAEEWPLGTWGIPRPERSPTPEGFQPWLLRCDEIAFTDDRDIDSVIEGVWDSRREVVHPKQYPPNMLRDCANPTSLIMTPFGSRGGR